MEWDVLYSLVRNNGFFSVNYFNEENRQGGGADPGFGCTHGLELCTQGLELVHPGFGTIANLH